MAQHKLVIAEKPSVAQNLAAVIGATVRKDGYLEGNGWRVSWCVLKSYGTAIFLNCLVGRNRKSRLRLSMP